MTLIFFQRVCLDVYYISYFYFKVVGSIEKILLVIENENFVFKSAMVSDFLRVILDLEIDVKKIGYG